MNFLDSIPSGFEKSKPLYNENAIFLNRILKDIDENLIKNIMNLSDKMLPGIIKNIMEFSDKNKLIRQAIFAYRGAVFKGIDAFSFNKKQMVYAQDHLKILSGMYGVLKPLDEIQEYRLEMKTSLKTIDATNIYAYWKNIITNYFETLDRTQIIINLASNEYSKVIDFSRLKASLINIYFGENTNNRIKSPPMYSKMARGKMTGYIIRNSLKTPEQIKDFHIDNYRFNPIVSDSNNYVFTR